MNEIKIKEKIKKILENEKQRYDIEDEILKMIKEETKISEIDLYEKNDTIKIIPQIERKFKVFTDIPYEYKEKYYRGMMKWEMGDKIIREVAKDLLKNKKWN